MEREIKAKDEYENFMNKIPYTHIMGCAAALTVGACGEYAKAEYTDANVVKLHWEATKDLFPRTFDDSFRRSDFYWLWSATFSQNFKHGKGDLYSIRKATDSVSYHKFHTADELQALPIDASLKKICKALGSRRFLAGILNDETVDTVRNKSVQPNLETTVTFEPYYDGETFFDAYGKGRLEMSIYQSSNGGTADLFCDFDFTFKKEDENVSMIGYTAYYRVGQDSVNFRFYSRPQALPGLFYSSIRESGLRIIDTYRDLCNVLYNGGHEDFEKHWAVCINVEEPKEFEVPLFLFGGDWDREHRADCHTRMLIRILPSGAFLKRIFGEDLWKILEKYNRVNRRAGDFRIDYTIKPLKNGEYWKYQDPDQFEVYLRISDRVWYSKSNKPSFGYSDGDFKEGDFNFIGFRFIFDIEKNKIRDVEFCDKLCFNGEFITEGGTEETTWDLFE